MKILELLSNCKYPDNFEVYSAHDVIEYIKSSPKEITAEDVATAFELCNNNRTSLSKLAVIIPKMRINLRLSEDIINRIYIVFKNDNMNVHVFRDVISNICDDKNIFDSEEIILSYDQILALRSYKLYLIKNEIDS